MSKHTCLHYGSKESLIDFVAPFFRGGLENNELCVWIVPESMGVEGAKEALGEKIKDLDKYIEKGQVEIFSQKDTYQGAGEFDPGYVLEMFGKKSDDAVGRGYGGLRVSGDASWVREADWDKWVDYEKVIDRFISERDIVALCTYPVELFDKSKIFTLSFSHGVTVRKHEGNTDILVDRTSMPYCD